MNAVRKEREVSRMPKVAVLSNVNMNMVTRMLGKTAEVYQAEGYGNELGIMMDKSSSYHAFEPQYTFLLMDLLELLEHDLEPAAASERIGRWFSLLEAVLCREIVYYVSDAYLWGAELGTVFEPGRKALLEQLWQQALEALQSRHENVRILPYRQLVERMGETASFSPKMWYMGKILLSNEAQKQLCELITHRLSVETRVPKKVLLLDLDNTLWGGLAGEHDITPIVLSEDHAGLAYKNLQRVIWQMQKQGVLLGIVSKNNEADAEEIMEKHPHMVLRGACFAAKRINWKPKHENIKEIARELNLGTDSFVFWDDNPAERELVKEMLPEVEVPDFPDKPEELAPAMVNLYKKFFEKAAVTGEDRVKTEQYAANAARAQLEQKAGSFEDYLEQLEIVVKAVKPEANSERLTQLVNKTNQFNLTTKRYTQGEMAEVLGDKTKRVYLYSVTDRFGDNGIVAAVIVNLEPEQEPLVEEFVMSCRVMGKRIEDAVIEAVEEDLCRLGFKGLRGVYLPTAKNQPVAELYPRLGYERIGDAKDEAGNACGSLYRIELASAPERNYRAIVESVEESH